MNNVELTVRTLEQAGVRWVFGVPSGPVLPFIEALRKSSGIDFILTASESAAGFMAEAVGRLTGVPGVCASTVGPGATNLATGVGGAFLDRSPVLAFTCNYPTRLLGRRTQMLIDHQALFTPITKSSFQLSAGNVSTTLSSAVEMAISQPPGPVHIDFPEDVALAATEEKVADVVSAKELGVPPTDLPTRVGALLKQAKLPIVVLGLTFTRSKRLDYLLEFIVRQGVPFVTTLHAKGFLPESHPACLGVMGRARRTDVQRMIDKADLLITVGFDPIEIDYEEWAANAPVIHLSDEPVQADTPINVVYQATGDIDAITEALASIEPIANEWDRSEWANHRTALDSALRPASNGMAAHHVIDLLRESLPPNTILTYDVGAHTHQIASQWSTDTPHTAVATNGWSSMGYGMPAAYAAKLVHPERTVVGVIGDGCFQMTVGELATARRLGLAVPIVVLNDGWLGLMKVKQERSDYPSSGAFLGEQTEPPTNYFGVPVRSVSDLSGLNDALRWALSLGGPSVIEAFIDVEPYSQTVFDI